LFASVSSGLEKRGQRFSLRAGFDAGNLVAGVISRESVLVVIVLGQRRGGTLLEKHDAGLGASDAREG